ncbi:MAG: hypothetical protein ACRDVK_02285, partial [Acidimicrobiia bacterium]
GVAAMIWSELPLRPTITVPAFSITKVRLVPSGMDSMELGREADGAAVVGPVTVGLVTVELVTVEPFTVGLVEVELVELELVVELLPLLKSLASLAQARPVTRSTTVTAAAARGIRYFTVDSPFGLESQCSSGHVRSASAGCQGSIKDAEPKSR